MASRVATDSPRDVTGAWLVSCPAEGSWATNSADQWADDDVRAAFFGTLFEPQVLAARLECPEAAHNPSRLIVEAYRRLGTRWLRALSGHFAFVLQDRKDNRLFAVRDAMGQCPLFYGEADGRLCFSISMDAILADGRVSGRLNRVALAEHLLHRWPIAGETYYENVRRIPPGHVLEVQGRVHRLWRHWDPVNEDGSTAWLREDEVERFDVVFERAVTRCLEGGRAGIFLSGGFDSISIAALAVDAAERSGHPVPRALSLGFPHPSCNEEHVQRGVAKALGLGQEFLPFNEAVGRKGLLAAAIDMAATWPAPMFNLWNPAYYELARRGREHGCSTVLTGTGGDEWLTVSPYLSADMIRRGNLLGVARLIHIHYRSNLLPGAQVVRGGLWRFGIRPILGMMADRLASDYWQRRRRAKMVASTLPWVAPDLNLRSLVDDRAGDGLLPSQPGPLGFYEREMRTALQHPLGAIEAEEYFEFGRRVGASIRHPYLDQDLVDMLFRTPPWLLMKGGRSKGLVRETVNRRFPGMGFRRHRKVQVTDFFWNILQKEGPAIWSWARKGSALADLGVIDMPKLSDTFRDLFAGRAPSESYKIWSVLNLEAWARARA